MSASASPTAASAGRQAIAFAASLVRQAGRRGAGAVAWVAAGAVLEGLGLALLVPLIGVIVAPGDSFAWLLDWLGGDARSRLVVLVAAFVTVMIVRALVLRRRDLALFDVQTSYTLDLRSQVVNTLAAAPWERLAGVEHARITSLLTSDIGRIGVAAHFMAQSLVAMAMIVIQLVVALTLAPVFAIAALAGLGLLALLVNRHSGNSAALGARMVDKNRALMGSSTSFLSGLKASAAQDASVGFAAEFDSAQRAASLEQRGFVVAQSTARTWFGIGTAFAAAGVLTGGVLAQVPPTVLVVLALIFSRMAPLAMQLQQSSQQLLHLGASYGAVQAALTDLGGAGVARAAAAPLPAGPILLDRVRYHHASGAGLVDASLQIGPGELIGIAGPSGGGKTTLIDLVSGLLVPQSGQVTVGGAPLPPGGWGAAIGYVPQDAFLFHDSVRRNLDWGDTRIDDAMLLDALTVAGAADRVTAMPYGLDTIIGERGALLSGGERQRLAIARAILRRPRLLVLDEATAALDPESEGRILDRLAALEPRPAILIVAHRIETLSRCPRVIRVEGGRLN
ncbi:ABC transporter ATP-binding protein/permease [Sphingomonas sp. R647]|uniref:ATP-binding cassette domain-containing protein n=1 Tax=Sphingomonas sp. R647 TaxID=2875233 RepID=UPI001CD349BE|nr:ABC transporter ATP-binding protein [Sphingomonas sp. R647]MCA1198812.1 ABC transporter ATP-binding protein/permease [Sphingomonas sp. R647]